MFTGAMKRRCVAAAFVSVGLVAAQSIAPDEIHTQASAYVPPSAVTLSTQVRLLPGLRLVASWLSKPAGDRTEKEQQWVQAVTNDHPEIATAENLAQRFRDMVKNRKGGDLDVWLESAETSGIPEFSGFAMGIRRDHAAVVAGIDQSWSNGQVEGQVHRLKLLKRQMYGRAGFLLLRSRVLPFPCGEGSCPLGHHDRSTKIAADPIFRRHRQLLQWFCGMGRLDAIQIPGKSALQRYSEWIPEPDMRKVVDSLLIAATQINPGKKDPGLGLAEPLDVEAYFLDTTCVKLNIHFPVDWVLLRDAARTLMKATMLIREPGLKVRMEEPKEFLKRMNQLCIRMTHARRKKDSKRKRKAVLREMKKLSQVIAGHAQRHHDLLEEHWRETDLKEGEARQIAGRMEVILERLPQAVKQAHERIIGERQVSNGEKILSLYEGHAAVYVRGKADAEVEFGCQLLLGECRSGVIVDWELVCGVPQADTKMLDRSLERLAGGEQDRTPRQIGGDRGFDSKANRGKLEAKGIYNGLCPRDPRELKKRIQESDFAALQQRRSQTEARISIFKNSFLGAPLKSKGYANQNLEVVCRC